MTDFDLSSYDYDLPEELIASRPVANRHSSKLLVYDEGTNSITHSTYEHIGDFLPSGATFVFNRSKVFPCRLIGKKPSGGDAEVFILSLMHNEEGLYPAMIKASGKRKVGDEFLFDGLKVNLAKITEKGFLVSVSCSHYDFLAHLEVIGKVPIPPYIRGGESDEADKETYQTVYAKDVGSVAVPTAGLHFSEGLLQKLKEKFKLATVTLHVGAGTFAPVKSENILDHQMHEEFYSIDEENLSLINDAKFRVAVGTTTLRTLESCYQNGKIECRPGEFQGTNIFLYPGKAVKSIDAMVTNFHLPKSSLIMLVSALIGRKKTLELYQTAIDHKYRFYSYGDGMLIIRDPIKLKVQS